MKDLLVELVSQKELNQFNIQICLHAQYTFFIMKVIFLLLLFFMSENSC